MYSNKNGLHTSTCRPSEWRHFSFSALDSGRMQKSAHSYRRMVEAFSSHSIFLELFVPILVLPTAPLIAYTFFSFIPPSARQLLWWYATTRKHASHQMLHIRPDRELQHFCASHFLQKRRFSFHFASECHWNETPHSPLETPARIVNGRICIVASVCFHSIHDIASHALNMNAESFIAVDSQIIGWKDSLRGQCRRFQVHARRNNADKMDKMHTILIKNVHVSSAIYANCLCVRLCLASPILTVILCRVHYQLRLHSLRPIYGKPTHLFDQVSVCFLARQPLQLSVAVATWLALPPTGFAGDFRHKYGYSMCDRKLAWRTADERWPTLGYAIPEQFEL